MDSGLNIMNELVVIQGKYTIIYKFSSLNMGRASRIYEFYETMEKKNEIVFPDPFDGILKDEKRKMKQPFVPAFWLVGKCQPLFDVKFN